MNTRPIFFYGFFKLDSNTERKNCGKKKIKSERQRSEYSAQYVLWKSVKKKSISSRSISYDSKNDIKDDPKRRKSMYKISLLLNNKNANYA